MLLLFLAALWVANVRAFGFAATSPLHVACQTGNEPSARLLIERGVNIDRADDGSGWSPLMVACYYGHTSMARLLLDHGANVNLADDRSWSPLMVAAHNGHGVTQLLLERGADVSQANSNGASSLFVACKQGHAALARLLLDHGALVDQAASDGASPLFISSQFGQLQAAKLLLERGAAINQTTIGGANSFHVACQENQIDIVRLLLEHGANRMQATDDGQTCASIAVERGHSALLELVMMHGNPRDDVPFAGGTDRSPLAFLVAFVVMVAAYSLQYTCGGADARAEAARRELLRESAETTELQVAASSKLRTCAKTKKSKRVPPRRRDHHPHNNNNNNNNNSNNNKNTTAPPLPTATIDLAAIEPPRELSRSASRIDHVEVEVNALPTQDGDDDRGPNADGSSGDEGDEAKRGLANALLSEELPNRAPTLHTEPRPDGDDSERYSKVAAVLASLGLGDEILLLFRTHEVDDDCLSSVKTIDLASIGLPLGTAVRVVSAAARVDASNSSKDFAEDLDVAAVQLSVLETKLRDHRAELARLKTALSARDSEIEEDLVCPITCELIHDPVFASDGNTYERAAIEAWFAMDKVTSPMTNAPLASLVLTPNNLARRLIAKILEECRVFAQLRRLASD